MSRRLFLAAAVLTVFLLGGLSAVSADDKWNPVARDLLILVDWFEGAFDNEEQRWFEADPRSNTPESERMLRIHTVHRRIELPDFGKHVFYVEEFKDNDPKDVFRQRLVIFTTDPDARAIRMQQGFFREPENVLGAHRNPELLGKLSKDQVFFMNECDVHWTRVAGQYVGAMKPKACVFGEGDERRYSVHDLILSSDKYWRVDSTFLVADDSLYKGTSKDRPQQLRRAKPFICDVYFYGEESQVVEDLELHSQGGMLSVTRSSDGAAFDVLLRDKEYPYYESRPDFLYLSIRRGGEQRSIAFSVNDPDSRQLGMRTEEVGAFCSREGYTFRESLTTLPN